jgi:Glycosyl hydrolase 36 superfamily, catalytic domain/Glycosyltransferase family 36
MTLHASFASGLLQFSVVVAFASACGSDRATEPPADKPYAPPPESCAGASVDDPTRFAPCSTGGGIFGQWVTDDLGLPAYDYGLDQNADARAGYPTTDGKEHRDHWAAFGNDRVNAMFVNDGYVEVTTQDRGASYLNKFDEEQHAFAGGFSWIDDGDATWTTAYKWRPRGSVTTRRFGMGYAEATMLHRDVAVLRRTFAPPGDAAAVVDEVTLENRARTAKSLVHYEYWDVARRPVEINWIASGKSFPAIPGLAAAKRDERNALFEETVAWDPAAKLLAVHRTHAPGVAAAPPGEPSDIDYYPGDPFLAMLVGDASDRFTDQASFFGDGDARSPHAVSARSAGEGLSATTSPRASGAGQPRLFVVKTNLTLAPGEKRTLRFAYGASAMGGAPEIDPSWRDPARDLRAETARVLEAKLFHFVTPEHPFLHRELAWHASQIEVSVGWREYWGRHVVPQGSAYLYLHGADGALRDTALFAIPLVYTHPALAKEQLSLAMGLAFAEDARFSYAFQGHGRLDDALGVHAKPSDLDLFFLWALTEYLGATGDRAFLDEKISYFPRSAGNEATVLEHLRRAVRHLFDRVGTGEHGLVHVGTGDWSDGISFEATDRPTAIAKGESVPNSQMALAVLPRVASLVAPFDAALATEIEGHVAALLPAVKATHNGTFFGRAYLGDGALYRADTLDLEAQVWALLATNGPNALLAPDERDRLVAEIARTLDDPSPIGAPLTRGGQVWPAISCLLTAGYAQSDDRRAFDHLARNTMAARAAAFPTVWHSVWSGPDGVNSSDGAAWVSPVTPMIDFPTMNNNAHAMPLLAALRVAGIEATARGLRIEPHVPGGELALRSALVDLTQHGAVLSGSYRPLSPRTLTVVAARGKRITAASIEGAAVLVPPDAAAIDLDIPAGGAKFEVSRE